MAESYMTLEKRFKDNVKPNNSQVVVFINYGKSKIYYNLYNGKKSKNLDEILDDNLDYALVKAGEYHQGLVDVIYDSKKDMLAIIMMEINCMWPDAGTKREATEYARYYVTKNKDFIFRPTEWRRDGYYYKKFFNERYYRMANTCGITDLPFKIKNYPAYRSKCFEEVYKMFPKYVTLAGNKLRALDNFENLLDFFRYKEPKAKDGPVQKEIDRLVKIELEDINIEKVKDLTNNGTFAVISKVNGESMCVLRSFIFNKDKNEIFEGGRIYIGKSKVYACKKCNDNTYIRTSLLKNPEHWNFPIATFDSDVTTGTKLAYFGDNIKDIDVENRGLAVFSFLKWGIMEKLFKSELCDTMKTFLKTCNTVSSMELYERSYGPVSNDKNIYKAIGYNKYQLQKILEDGSLNYKDVEHRFYQTPATITKTIIGKLRYGSYWSFEYDNRNEYVMLNDTDNETFDVIYNIAKRIKGYGYIQDDIIVCFVAVSRLYGISAVIKVSDYLFNMADEDERNNNRSYIMRQRVRNYRDYLTTVELLNDTVNFKPYFKTEEDITRLHDAAVALYNLKRDECNKKAFEKRIEKWSKWEYEDENYAVVAPKIPEDLAREGMELHHCVKTYIGKVSSGITNIMFIRKKDDIETPFFTVEISNDNKIEQIHGSCNRNLSSEPELEYFVNDWCKAKKLGKNNFNKVR